LVEDETLIILINNLKNVVNRMRIWFNLEKWFMIVAYFIYFHFIHIIALYKKLKIL
jgi:hypothetical protein